MALTDHITATLLKYMDKAFNDPANVPVGDLAGPTQLRPGVGLPALDNFQDCAMAWIMAGARGKTETFPAFTEMSRCSGSRLWEFSIGVARCSTALDEGARLPSLETMEAEFAVQEDDKDRLDWAACQAAKELEKDYRISNYAFTPLEVYGPMGATVAVYKNVLVMPQGGSRK